MKKAAARVLLVYGYEPSGHSAAAFSLEESCRAAGFLVSRVEIAGDHHPAAGAAVARGYHGLLRACPRAWGALYRSSWARLGLRGVRRAYLSLAGARRMRDGVSRAGADVVVCPQASVAAVLAFARARGELDVPVVSVLTDYDAHPFWSDPPADLVVAPDASTAGALAAQGVPAARLRTLGVPIHPAFASMPSRVEARRALSLPASAQVVLVSGGSKGLGGVELAAAAILRAAPRAFVLALCGGNQRAFGALATLRESGSRLRAFGRQPPAMVSLLLAASDLHAGKPGGLSSAETMAAGVPMVLTRPLPGQEEANARHLTSAGGAVYGGAPRETARLCARLLAERPLLAVLSEAAARASRPGASAAIAAELTVFLGLSTARPLV